MAVPEPKPGLLISYAYLWRDEARRGQEEGVKDRPCVILHTSKDREGSIIVRVVPVTHSQPRPGEKAVEIPAATKQRLGLDDSPSWIKTNEVNRLTWPGPDLRPVSRKEPGNFVHGILPRGLFNRVRDNVLEHVRERTLKETRRDE